MSTDITKANGGLPSNVTNMAASLAAAMGTVGASGGSDFYAGMDKTGTHYYGADRTEINADDKWALNIQASEQFWTAWGTEEYGTDGQNVGEVSVPLTGTLPLEADLPEVKGKWAKGINLHFRCVEGEDEEVQIQWKSNSHGGRKAFTILMQAVVQRIQAGEAAYMPIVHMESDSYQHKKYGKIFTPVFEIVGWTDGENLEAAPVAQVEDQSSEEPAEEPAPEEKAPRRRRRKSS